MRLAPLLMVVTAGLVACGGAQAGGLRAGGVLAGAGEEPLGRVAGSRGVAGAAVVDERLVAPELRFGFTPRAGGGLLVDTGEEPGAGSLGLRLGLAPAAEGLGRLDGLGLVGRPAPPGGAAGEASQGLTIGGALAWSGWTLGGSYASEVQPGASLDLWTGQLAYGPLTARLGYGQEVTVGRPARELWLFGTDVATWSWLTLEGDVAVTTQPDREPTTVGRLGLRLNF